MNLDLSRCRLTPFNHQVVGIQKLIENPYYGLFDEMGAGKTLQVIVAAQILAIQGTIDRVIVICPASVRNVWFDPELGELSKHLWVHFSCLISEYHSRIRKWTWFNNDPKVAPDIRWVISNYDFIRKQERLNILLKISNSKTLLVLDESSAIKSYRALQTKACLELRKRCGRVIILNGTPIANNPGDLYSQAEILHPSILGVKSWFHFRARYGIMGGFLGKQIVAWRDLPDLQNRLKPYVIRRLKKDCLDLPEKLDSVIISVPMSSRTWGIYKQMRDEMVAWLNDNSVSAAQQAIVKAIRLSQITSGFLGGVETETELDEEGNEIEVVKMGPVEEVGQEKFLLFLDWLADRLLEDPDIKVLVWCRFRPEVERLFNALTKNTKLHLGKIWGGQKIIERENTLRLLDPRTNPSGPVVVIGTPASGSMGLNLTAAHTVIYLSNDYSLKTRLQSEDRVHRPGQIHNVSYFDVIATGPDGQKTIDHVIIKALKNKQEIATFTTSAWIQALTEE